MTANSQAKPDARRKPEAQRSVGETMRALGAGGARGGARAGTGLHRGQEHGAAGGSRGAARGDYPHRRGQQARPGGGARGGAAGLVPRPADARCQAHRRRGQGARGDRGAARSGRRGDGRMDAPQRPPDPARARAAGRGRHHLREPAQRDGRCRRALPQGRQRRDPARRLGEPPFGPRHPRLPRARPARGRACPRPPSSWCRPPTARRSG